ncbi:nucleotidyl transferase AbiEii/AbiGii toxin family protein [Asinibacterium sp. OR53]|uniref:nucleotidyl transferase AbiEii/AbiGii toxin family protein n=1 Tax=Asinibacterium sp. OR53 TaxID=925409 RepID=UPI0004B88796|nr:nucleotidyl transferase AbiEii/AbiGii toxin family protein [Asinibacterium sp. OR53]
MSDNQAVSQELLETIHELQQLSSLSEFGLAGGTNLALRYGHRISVDIDLFSPSMIGIKGLENICEQIKVEIMQNVPLLDEFEINDAIRMVTVKDIGVLKLKSLCSRMAKKDAYDLDLITDQKGYSLEELIDRYQEKETSFSSEADEWAFDLDEHPNPADDPKALLAFDETGYIAADNRPTHSDDQLNIIPSSKLYRVAKASWRRKVRDYMSKRGFQLPPAKPVN